MSTNNDNKGGWSPSSIKPGGWIIILAILFAIFWFGIKPRLHSASNNSVAGNPSGGTDLGGNPTQVTQTQGSDILVLTTNTKRAWLQNEIDKFNQQSSNGKATLSTLESRDAMQAVLAGKVKPAVWSPSSPMWITRLSQVVPAANIDTNSSDSYRNLFKSPLVFLVNKSKLAQLQPILSGSQPFDRIRKINQNGVKIRFGYADPIKASSGTLTVTLLLNEYADLHNSSDLSTVSSSNGFSGWLRDVDKGLVRSDLGGSSILEKAFESNPSSRDFITAYESSALTAIANNPDLAIVYPNPTANADQAAVITAGPWLSDAQRATSKAFLQFIAAPSALADGLQYNFRPNGPSGADQLGQHLPTNIQGQYHGSYRALELPSYDAINNANVIWHSQVK